jgi:hypothetical protein
MCMYVTVCVCLCLKENVRYEMCLSVCITTFFGGGANSCRNSLFKHVQKPHARWCRGIGPSRRGWTLISTLLPLPLNTPFWTLVNLAIRICTYLNNEIDIGMYWPKNTAKYLHFFNVRICKYVSICMYHMYLFVYACICLYDVCICIVCICMYCVCIHK